MKFSNVSRIWYFLGSMFIIYACSEMWWHRFNKKLDAQGVDIPAEITSVVYGRGYNIDFQYTYHGKQYRNNGNTTEFDCEIGDSILIRVIAQNPDGNFRILKNIYRAKKRSVDIFN